MSNIDTEEEEDEEYTDEYEEYTDEYEDYTEDDGDKVALLAFYKSSGMEQHFPDRWNINVPYRNWYGVETSNDDRVTKLCCEGGLEGEIPPEIGDLSELEKFYLHYSVLKCSIPKTIGNLKKLKILSLISNRKLWGPIPREIGNLVSLTELNLADNALSGPLPREIGNLSKLTRLALYHNKLTGPLPPEIGNLVNLEFLDLDYNSLSGWLPLSISNLTKLLYFCLQGNKVEHIDPDNGQLDSGDMEYLTAHFNKYSANVKTCLHGTIVGKRGSYHLPAELIEHHIAPYLISPQFSKLISNRPNSNECVRGVHF